MLPQQTNNKVQLAIKLSRPICSSSKATFTLESSHSTQQSHDNVASDKLVITPQEKLTPIIPPLLTDGLIDARQEGCTQLPLADEITG